MIARFAALMLVLGSLNALNCTEGCVSCEYNGECQVCYQREFVQATQDTALERLFAEKPSAAKYTRCSDTLSKDPNCILYSHNGKQSTCFQCRQGYYWSLNHLEKGCIAHDTGNCTNMYSGTFGGLNCI